MIPRLRVMWFSLIRTVTVGSGLSPDLLTIRVLDPDALAG